MPFRFRRSLRIAPGVRLNIGTGGISTSVGGRGGLQPRHWLSGSMAWALMAREARSSASGARSVANPLLDLGGQVGADRKAFLPAPSAENDAAVD